MNIVRWIVLLCTLYFATSVFAFQQCQRSQRSQRSTIEKGFSPSSSSDNKVGEPLLLTPLIHAEKLDEAKNQSRVAPLLDNIESYAGYLTVNETTRSHLYFWYFPPTTTAATTAASVPLILWLQGGPGISSLFGLFTENGPFRVTKNGTTLEKRVHAWTNNYHVLYIDQPVGTGYSYTERDGYVRSQEEVGEHLYEALTQFYQLFSELKNHDLYIAGDGYAGKFIPTIGYKIHTLNDGPSLGQRLKMPLAGMIIGNGYSDPEYMQDFGEHYYGLGLIDEMGRAELEVRQKRIKHLLRAQKWFQAVQEVHELYKNIGELIDSISMVDYTGDHFFLNYSLYENFVQLDRVRERIHVGRAEHHVISEKVHLNFLVDMMKTVRPSIEELLKHYPMLFYSGQFDLLAPPPFIENFLNHLYWPGADEFGLARRQIWRVGNKVAGFYKSGANLVYVMVRNAGAYVPTDQPENALNLIDMFIGKKFQN